MTLAQKSTSESLLQSKEILRLTSEKPSGILPLWELALGFCFAVVFSLLFYFGAFDGAENALVDFRFKQRGHLSANNDIVLINITDDCIDALGSWPWPRKTHAKLLSILNDCGAKTVAFDLIFSEPSLHGEQDDLALAEEIKKFGHVVLPIIFQEAQVLDNETGEITSKTIISHPLEAFRKAGALEGYIDIEYKTLNPDGVIRKLLLQRDADNQYYYILGIVAASDYLKANPKHVVNGLKIAGRTLPYITRYEPEAGVRRQSYMVNYAGDTHHFTEIAYSDVLERRFPQGFFKNRVVLIGVRAEGASEDVKFCPYGAISGVQIHANVLQNILTQRVINRPAVETTILIIFVFALGAAYLLLKNKGFASNLYVLGGAGCWLLLGILLFYLDIVMEITPIVLMILPQWAITRLCQQFFSLRQKNYELACKVRELAIINEVSQAVSYMGDLKKTLDAVLSRCVQVLNAERGSIFMLDEKYEELIESAAVYGVSGEVIIDEKLKEQFKLGHGIAGEVFNSGRARLIQNVRKEKNFAVKEGENNKLRTLICVPLLIKASSIGVMNIVNRCDGYFNREDLQTAITMANQAAVVIEKARLFNLATVDGLTGLVVHRHFKAKMEEEFRRAKRYKKALSFMMTDIDHFKKFNDTWGHQTGDMVLREVAKIVRDNARETDVTARYGGEEFAVILPETEPEGAMLLAERIRERVDQAVFKGPKGNLHVTISIGVCSIPLINPQSVDEMIKMADEALYVCKANGRNRVEQAQDRPKPNSADKPTDNGDTDKLSSADKPTDKGDTGKLGSADKPTDKGDTDKFGSADKPDSEQNKPNKLE